MLRLYKRIYDGKLEPKLGMFTILAINRFNVENPIQKRLNRTRMPRTSSLLGELVSVACHRGDVNAGHFVSYHKVDGHWYLNNDSRQCSPCENPLEGLNIEYCREGEKTSETVELLFFKKHQESCKQKLPRLIKKTISNANSKFHFNFVDWFELDPEVVKVCEKYLSKVGNKATTKNSVQCLWGDAFESIKNVEDNKYDKIFVDLNDDQYCIDLAKKNMKGLKRILKKGGVITAQVGSQDKKPKQVEKWCNVLERNFGNVKISGAYIPSFDCKWNFVSSVMR